MFVVRVRGSVGSALDVAVEQLGDLLGEVVGLGRVLGTRGPAEDQLELELAAGGGREGARDRSALAGRFEQAPVPVRQGARGDLGATGGQLGQAGGAAEQAADLAAGADRLMDLCDDVDDNDVSMVGYLEVTATN